MTKPVTTPRLIWNHNSNFLYDPEAGRDVFCVDELQKFVNVPKAKSYWVQARRKQWANRSGSPVKLQLDKRGWLTYWNADHHNYECMIFPLGDYAQKLGIKPGQTAMIYICLLYEE
jgi:hypothetical protein